MDGPLRLGGNIELFGVEKFDGATLIVLKKIIGTYARKFSEKGLSRLSVAFADKNIKVEGLFNENTYTGQSNADNVFFCVDNAFKDMEKQF